MDNVMSFYSASRKVAAHEGSGRPAAFFPVAAVIVLAFFAVLSFEAYSGMLGMIGPHFEIVQQEAGRIIKVPPGGNLQAAVDNSKSGDIIELQAGAIYSGEIKLPSRPHTDFVTIRSSAIADLPVGQRVSPARSASMAAIRAPAGKPAVSAADGAHHYRFIGIEFSPTNSAYNFGLIAFGGRERRPELVPHHLEIDRSYIHPFTSGVVRRGIALNSADTVISNSHISGFGFKGEETQGICGWTGSRNVKIINNYIEGGAENIMFGGADPANAELIPTEIEIRGNHLNKPAEWAKSVTIKTLFELKNARRVNFEGNILTNNWEGAAFRITVRNQDGKAPFSTIEDVTIANNIIDGSGEGINILGKDDTYPSQTQTRLIITNNLFLNIGDGRFDGSGYFVQIAGGQNITVANNTVFNRGNITTFYGELPTNFVFRDNIVGHGSYGIHGHPDIRSEAAKAIFQNNAIVNNLDVGVGDTSYPAGNIWVSGFDAVGFTDLAGRDLRLTATSRFRQAGSAKKDIGVDIGTLPQMPR